MFECVLVGDHLTNGIQKYKNECVQMTQESISSLGWNKNYKFDLQSKIAVISLGTYDPVSWDRTVENESLRELSKMRAQVRAERVYWLIPITRAEAADAVRTLAQLYNDTILMVPGAERDGVTPTDQASEILANQIK